MKCWKRITVLVLLLTVCLALAGCAKHYRITSSDDRGVISKYPKSAAAGQTVTVQSAYICDGVAVVYFNGEKANSVGGNEYEFIMPGENVVLTAKVVTNNGA